MCDGSERHGLHERLDGLSILIFGIRDQGVERVTQTALADELERSPTHPSEDVELLLAILDTTLDSKSQLYSYKRL